MGCKLLFVSLLAGLLLLTGCFPPVPASNCVSVNGLPDGNCTPGAIDPGVTQGNIHSTICVSGYTDTVRPSTSYTNPVKVWQIAQYGWTGSTSDYEEDHLIPLELGGNPTDAHNLWPEPYAEPNGARDKDKVENALHAKVCSGQVALADAQNEIATNWEAVSNSGSAGGSTPPPPPPGDTPTGVCCKVCTNSQACGDSCISKSYTCYQPPGCACNAK